LLTGDRRLAIEAWQTGPLGQTANSSGFYYYGTRGSLVVSGTAALAATGVGFVEATLEAPTAAHLGLQRWGIRGAEHGLVKDHLFRWGWSRVYGWHAHAWPAMQWHLPTQAQRWYYHTTRGKLPELWSELWR
jgi:hypothetical protein